MKNLIAILLLFNVSNLLYAQINTDTGGGFDEASGSFQLDRGAKYVISAWVSEDLGYLPHTYEHSFLELYFTDSSDETPLVFYPSGAVINGWQRIYGVFTVPVISSIFKLDLVNDAGFDSSSYFDDIRVIPFNGNMKSFVYDAATQRLMAELDENNYATFYEYDTEGGLVRIKKETSRGIKTIQETRSSNAKNN